MHQGGQGETFAEGVFRVTAALCRLQARCIMLFSKGLDGRSWMDFFFFFFL